jgi:hypothetical protein
VPTIDYIRAEIERIRAQVHRQRGEIRQLQRAGILTASAEARLERMLAKIDGLCLERDHLRLRLTPHPGIFRKMIPMFETVMTFLGVLSASVFLAHAFEAYRTR